MRRRHCPETPTACRGWSASGSESQRGSISTFILPCPLPCPPARDGIFQQFARGFVRDGIEGFGQERAHQNGPRLLVGNAPAAEVKQSARHPARRWSRRGCTSRRRRKSRVPVWYRSRRRATAAAPGSFGIRQCLARRAPLRYGPGTRRATSRQHVLHGLPRRALRRRVPHPEVKSPCCDPVSNCAAIQMRDRSWAIERRVNFRPRDARAEH